MNYMNSEYIKAIADKLDRLKAASGENSNVHPTIGPSFDHVSDVGDASIAYLKKIGKWPINGDQRS